MSIILTKDFASLEHHHLLLDLLLNDTPEDTQEAVMFVLRMHNTGGSVNLQKAVTEERNVNSLDVIAKHKILDSVGLAPQQISALSCHAVFHSRGTGNVPQHKKNYPFLSLCHCRKPLDALFKQIDEQIKVVHQILFPQTLMRTHSCWHSRCCRSYSYSQNPSCLSILCDY